MQSALLVLTVRTMLAETDMKKEDLVIEMHDLARRLEMVGSLSIAKELRANAETLMAEIRELKHKEDDEDNG